MITQPKAKNGPQSRQRSWTIGQRQSADRRAPLALRTLRTGILLILLSSILAGGCMSDQRASIIKKLHHLDLPEMGITILLPGDWQITYSEKGFYQVVASGFASNGSLSTFEFRSLPNRLRDTAAKVLFANGWYQSVRDNYPGWEFTSRRQTPGDPEGTFEFDGRFEKDGVAFRRIGRLRFREDRVHAMYYTTHDTGMAGALFFFETIDSQHKYYKPGKEAVTSITPIAPVRALAKQ